MKCTEIRSFSVLTILNIGAIRAYKQVSNYIYNEISNPSTMLLGKHLQILRAIYMFAKCQLARYCTFC
jgi:hypothetical protein